MVRVYVYVDPDNRTLSVSIDGKKLSHCHHFVRGWPPTVTSKQNLICIGEKVGRNLRLELSARKDFIVINGSHRASTAFPRNNFVLRKMVETGALDGDQLSIFFRGIRSVLN